MFISRTPAPANSKNAFKLFKPNLDACQKFKMRVLIERASNSEIIRYPFFCFFKDTPAKFKILSNLSTLKNGVGVSNYANGVNDEASHNSK